MKSNEKTNYCTKFMYFTGGMLFVLAVMQLMLHGDLALNQKNTSNLRNQKSPDALPKGTAMGAEGFPVGYNPANFGKSFGILNNGNKDVEVGIYAISDGKVILDASSNLDVGSESHYHLPWEKEKQLKFKIWLDGDEIADNVPEAQYRLCDSVDESFSAMGEERKALLRPSDSPFGAAYRKYCQDLTLFNRAITTNNPAPLLRGLQ